MDYINYIANCATYGLVLYSIYLLKKLERDIEIIKYNTSMNEEDEDCENESKKESSWEEEFEEESVEPKSIPEGKEEIDTPTPSQVERPYVETSQVEKSVPVEEDEPISEDEQEKLSKEEQIDILNSLRIYEGEMVDIVEKYTKSSELDLVIAYINGEYQSKNIPTKYKDSNVFVSVTGQSDGILILKEFLSVGELNV
jgi:hypothetical protein